MEAARAMCAECVEPEAKVVRQGEPGTARLLWFSWFNASLEERMHAFLRVQSSWLEIPGYALRNTLWFRPHSFHPKSVQSTIDKTTYRVYNICEL
jgi:hypothetical protein